MDGNGRWANARGLPRNYGHQKGVENVERIVEKARDLKIKHLTLYAFSAENWKRPKEEVDALMALLETFLHKQAQQLMDKKIRLHTIGRIKGLPPSVLQLLEQVKKQTEPFTEYNLTLALNYGARDEVLDAVNRYTDSLNSGETTPAQLDWSTFSQFLDTAGTPDPELVIRTSGEHRISNFLLLQSAYSEFLFSPVCWPDFDPEHLEQAITDFTKRERRFGKTGEQIKNEQSPPLPKITN